MTIDQETSQQAIKQGTRVQIASISKVLFAVFAANFFFYTFISPVASANGYLFAKNSSITTLGSACICLLWDAFRKLRTAHALMLLWTFLVIPVYLLSWSNIDELNLLLTPLLGYVAYTKKDDFKRILFAFFLLNLVFVVYEWIAGAYLYTEVVIGRNERVSFTFDPAILGDVGFRPKGLLFGTLDATALCIAVSIIFHDRKLLLLSAIAAIIINGRLAILLTAALFLASIYLNSNVRRSSLSTIKLIAQASVAIVSLGIILVVFLDESAVSNFLSVADITSQANAGRLLFMATGIEEYFQYSFRNLVFGDSGHYEYLYGNSAESGLLNIFLNAGLVGAVVYLSPLVTIIRRAARYGESWILGTSIAAAIALLVFRFEAGFLRGTLFWFFIFNALEFLEYTKRSMSNRPDLQ